MSASTFDAGSSRAPQVLRIVVIEDNTLTREGLVALVGRDPTMQVVGEAEDGIQGLELYRSLEPDVVLMDLRMPRFDGVALTTALQNETPKARVLVVTQYEGEEHIWGAMRAGALGYVTKDVRRAELYAAIREVAAGRRYLPAAIAERMAQRVLAPTLTPRELQVLQHVFKGQSNRQIAAELTLAEKTVILYVSSILSKLGVRSRTEAVAVALQRGILSA